MAQDDWEADNVISGLGKGFRLPFIVVSHSLIQGGEPQIVQVVQQNWLCPNLRFGNKPFRPWWASQRRIRLCGTTIFKPAHGLQASRRGRGLAFQAAKHLRPRFNLAKGSLKKGCFVRLNVVETAVALNIRE